jgi:chitodextrinase
VGALRPTRSPVQRRISVETGGDADRFRATRGAEAYTGEDPVAVLGLVKLIETRGWSWQATDAEVDRALQQYRLE